MGKGNGAIGGVPTMKYFGFKPLGGFGGRGAVVRFFWLTNDIEFNDQVCHVLKVLITHRSACILESVA